MLVGLVLAASVFMQGSPLTAPVQTHVDVTVQAPPPDPKAIADASVQSTEAIVVTLVAPTLVKWVDDLLDIPDIFRHTPPDLTYANSAVISLANTVRLVALGLLALAILAAGLGHALVGDMQYGRVVFGAILSAANLIWWQIGITLLNSINDAIAAPPLQDTIKPHLEMPGLTANPVEAFGPALLVIVYAVVALMLLLTLVFRLGTIDILIAVGSLGLFCAVLDETSSLFQTYVRLSVGVTFSQVLIVICLKLAPILGGLGTGVVGTLLGIVVLLLARQAPAWLSSASRSSNGLGRLAGLMVLRRMLLRF